MPTAPGVRDSLPAHKLCLQSARDRAGKIVRNASARARPHAGSVLRAGQESLSADSVEPSAFTTWVTPTGMHVACYDVPIAELPADFFADPDGSWTYDALVQAAGFAAYQGVAIGALKEPFNKHPEGAAVVTLNSEARPYVAVIECPIAYECMDVSAHAETSAA